jgi:flagellin-specific chaperone FliS
MGSKSALAYAANSIETGVVAADSSQLIVLVYERLFDHLKIGKKELENGRYAIESFTKAHDLIQQGLVACIDYKEVVILPKASVPFMSGPYARSSMLV